MTLPVGDRSVEGTPQHAGRRVEPEEQPELLDDEVDRESLLSMDASDPPSLWAGPDEPHARTTADHEREVAGPDSKDRDG